NVMRCDLAHLFATAREQSVGPGPPADVDVLAQLYVAVGPENREAAVAERGKRIGREPIDANVAAASVAAQHHIAEIFQAGILRVAQVADLRSDDIGTRGAGEEQERVEIVRREIAQDSTVALALEEPRRTRRGTHPVRREAHRL